MEKYYVLFFILYPSQRSILLILALLFQCINHDGVTTELSISYQYKVRANELNDVVMQFRKYDFFQTILFVIGITPQPPPHV